MSTGSSYYDIEDILAEEELIPVNSLLDFNYLAHLDPDYVNGRSCHDDDDNDNLPSLNKPQKRYLKEGTKFKMPLWSIEKWAQVGFVKMSLPKHYGKRARERLGADPVSVDMR